MTSVEGTPDETTAAPSISTIGALRESGWTSRPVKEEVRRNAVAKIKAGEPLFAGVMGYEETVMPQLENALLAGHDVIFLGERGQAKTRMIRSLTGLLDEWMPIVKGSEINDDPYAPVSRYAKDLVDENGDEAAAGEAGTVYFGGGPDYEYHNAPDKTDDVKDPGGHGWTTLGDVGYLD